MADVNSVDDAANVIPTDGEIAPIAKKTRKPRRPKAAADTSVATGALTTDAPVKKTRAKRGSKSVLPSVQKSAGRKPNEKTARSVAEAKAISAPSTQLDDIASLMQLEEENKKLRKQLFDKLHAENADLRKRLGKD